MADAENSLKYIEKGGYILFDDFTFKFSFDFSTYIVKTYEAREGQLCGRNSPGEGGQSLHECIYIYQQYCQRRSKKLTFFKLFF